MIKTPHVLLAGLLLLSACAPAATTGNVPTPMNAAQTAAPAPAAKLIHLKVGTLNYLSWGALFIAQADGYFAEQGLDVEFVSFGNFDAPMIAALSQSQLDVAPMAVTVALLNAIAGGANIKLVADKGFANPNACASSAWMASKKLLDNGSLKDLAGIKGRSVVTYRGNTIEWALDLLLKKAGLTRADVNILDIQDSLAQVTGLGNGSIDVTFGGEPWIARARKQGVGDVWIPFSDLMPNASVGGIVYGPSILDKNPDAGVRFMTAYLKGIKRYSEGKTDSNVAVLAKYTKLSPEEIRDACWTSFQPDGKIATQGLLDFQQWAVDKGYVAKAVDLSRLWDPQFVDQANSLLK